MGIKFLKYFVAITITFLLYGGCIPGGEDGCDGYGGPYVFEENLITITPFKSTYQQGEEVVFKIDIPSQNNYFGNPVDIYQQTNLTRGSLVTNSLLFDSNTVVFVKGSKKEGALNFFYLHYNPQNQLYELEIKVKLNRVGNYQFYTSDLVDFIVGKCDGYTIQTSIQGHQNHQINFIVE